MTMKKTSNGETALDSTRKETVDLFYNIGSSRNAKERVMELFEKAVSNDPETTTAIIAWARDARSGAGEREVFRTLLRNLIKKDSSLASKLIKLVPTIGRFDDLRSGFNTSVEETALDVWESALNDGNELAHKWVDIKKDHRLRKRLGLTNKEFRKKIVSGRKNIVETKMCKKQWNDIEYDKVPSVCMNKFRNAFKKNDETRFNSWLNDDDSKVNASVLYPYQIFQTWKSGDHTLAKKQWDNLSMEINGSIIPMIDTSGSMSCEASKGVTCFDVAVSLGTYLAQNNNGPFQNKMLNFDESAKLHTLSTDVDKAFRMLQGLDWGYNTNFESAYTSILKHALVCGAKQEDMPEYMVVLSDMQFDEAQGNSMWSRSKVPTYATAFGKMNAVFKQNGYKLPKVVFWNLNARYDNFPSSSEQDGVAMVSGFSPYVMKSIMDADLERITPYGIMNSTIEKYRKLLDEQ